MLKLIRDNFPQLNTPEDFVPPAIRATVDKLNELADLKDNWDSYGALSPTKKSLIGATQLINDLFLDKTPIPDVFPVPNGNIQVEWSIHGLDIEIEISKCNSYVVSFEDLNSGDEFERTFSYNLIVLKNIIEDLTQRHTQQHTLKVVNA